MFVKASLLVTCLGIFSAFSVRMCQLSDMLDSRHTAGTTPHETLLAIPLPVGVTNA